MKKRCILVRGCMVLIVTLMSASAWAVPGLINYQGKLNDTFGDPLDGAYNVHFYLYLVDSGGSSEWDESQSVTMTEGIYSVQLGAATSFPAGLFENDDLYLEVAIYNPDTSSWETLSPRQRLTSTAFAMKAEKAEDADTLDGLDSTQFAGDTHGHSFSDITGSASDAQIPNDITIDYAATSGDADTVDGQHAADFASATHGHSFPDITGTASDAQIPPEIARDSELTWSNLSGIPAGFADGIDNTGLLSEVDPQVGSNVFNFVPKWDGSALVSGSIYDNGNVGIGTTAPVSKLHVLSNSSTRTGYFETSLTQNWIGFYTDNGYIGYTGVWSDPYDIDIGTGAGNTTGSVNLVIGATPKLTVNQDGNVGIGRTNPTAKLHVSGQAGEIGIFSDGADFVAGNGGGLLVSGGGKIDLMNLHGDGPIISLDPNSRRITTPILEITGGSDIAEPFEVANIHTINPGMVLSIDPEHPGQLRIADMAYDRTVAGIVSGANGINPGLTMSQKGTVADGSLPVALTGRVYAWADASQAIIQPGDLLTTSDTPGHIMKVSDYAKAQGAIIGKAMTKLEQGKGLVLVLVTLQ